MPPRVQGVVSPEELAAAVADPVRTVITPEGWKLNCSVRGEHELYNLVRDPGETENLYGRGEYGPVASELAGHISRWLRDTGDTVQLPRL